jgi:hypothetical protein
MADGIQIKNVETTGETVERDHRLISGAVHTAVEYGDITLTLPISFSAKASHKDAVCDALRRLENLGHFLEAQAQLARSQYQCN